MPKQKLIAVSKLRFDPDNPRFYELRELKGAKKLSQEDLKNEMMSDKERREITKLEKAIKKSGVKDPIWVVPQEDDTFLARHRHPGRVRDQDLGGSQAASPVHQEGDSTRESALHHAGRDRPLCAGAIAQFGVAATARRTTVRAGWRA